jgi:hypothetical protein
VFLGVDICPGGRNADFFFAEMSALTVDATDGGKTLIDGGGNTSDDTSAGNAWQPQDSDWLLFEGNDDDEPVYIWLNDDNRRQCVRRTTTPDGVDDGMGPCSRRPMDIDDIENIRRLGQPVWLPGRRRRRDRWPRQPTTRTPTPSAGWLQLRLRYVCPAGCLPAAKPATSSSPATTTTSSAVRRQ